MTQRLSADYWRFWTASALSNLGDGLRLVALPLLAATITRDPLPVSVITAMGFLPWLVVGPVSGAVVDRARRQRLIVLVQLIRGMGVAAFTVAVVLDAGGLVAIYAIALVIGLGETLADTAAQAAIPRLAGPAQLEKANSRLIVAEVATNEVVGGPLGGALFAIAHALPFGIDAATYLMAAGLVAGIRTDLDPVRAGPPMTTVWSDVRDGLRWLRHDRLLFPVACAVGVVNFGFGGFSAILVLFALDELGLGSVGFGLLLGVGAVGGMFGALLAEQAARRFGRTASIVGTTIVAALATPATALAPNAVTAGLGLAVAFGAIGAFNVVGRALRQAITPDHLLGRVVAAFRLVGAGTVPFGALFGGWVASVTGLRAPFVLAGGLLLVAAAVEARALDDDTIAARVAEARPPT